KNHTLGSGGGVRTVRELVGTALTVFDNTSVGVGGGAHDGLTVTLTSGQFFNTVCTGAGCSGAVCAPPKTAGCSSSTARASSAIAHRVTAAAFRHRHRQALMSSLAVATSPTSSTTAPVATVVGCM